MSDWSESAYQGAHDDMSTQPAGDAVAECPRVVWDGVLEAEPSPAWEASIEVVSEETTADAAGPGAAGEAGPAE